jgi:hypothetical protein
VPVTDLAAQTVIFLSWMAGEERRISITVITYDNPLFFLQLIADAVKSI